MKHKFLTGLLTVMAMLLPMTVKAQCDSGTPCTVSIYGYDSYGDGWEGSLTIYRNNTTLQTFDVSDYEDSLILTVCQGDLIRVEWSGSDNYQENTFTILNGPIAVVEDAHGYTYASSGTVAEFSACPTCLPITNLMASDIDTVSMTLSWTDTENSGASYTITYNDADGIMQTLTSTTASIDITGLTAGFAYTFSVVANCSATDASTAVTGTFATANGACTGATCHITLEMVDSYGDGWNGGYVGLYNGDTEVDTWTVSGNSSTVSVEVCGSSTYKLRLVERGSYPSEMGITVLDGGGMEVFSVSGMGSYQNGDLMTLITNACPSCFRPDSIEFSSIVSDGADMTWVAGNDESEWLVYLNDSLVADVTSPSYSFAGLEANTGYTVSIRSLCSTDDTSAAQHATFRTACEGSSCEITVVSSAGYSSTSYCPTLHVWQNGDEVATVCAATEQVSVCSGDSVVIIYGAPSYTWYSPSATILDGAGIAVFEGSTSSLSNGSVLASFLPCPSCIPPMALTVSDVAQDEFTFSWTPRSDATLFALYLNDSLVDPAWVDTFYTFYNLESNTAYTASVQSICSSDDSSVIVSRSVRTACGEISLPYMVDFEDAAFNGAWYPCWDSTIHAGTDPSVNNANGNHTAGGQYSMYLQATTAENYNLVVSPQVPLPGNAINVSFWAKRNSGWIKAGVMTDPRDTSTFVPMVEVTSSDWAEYEFNTSELSSDSTYYVAWLGFATVSYSTTYIGKFDDVTISEFTGCSRPEEATVGTVGPYTAELSWTGVDDGSEYNIYYNTVNDISGANVQIASVYGDTTVVLDGLLPQQTYYAWVTTVCGSAQSDPKAFPYFTTQLTCAPVENVTLDNVTYVAAQISWSYNTTLGFPSSEVQLVLTDNTIGETVDSGFYEGTNHTYTGLTGGHSYTVHIRNICETSLQFDTANVVNFSFMTSSCSELAGNTNNTYMPSYTYYGNTYSQIIYTSDEMPDIDTIHGIAFNITSPNGGSNEARTFDVYVSHIDTTGFAGNNTFVTVGSSELVAENKTFHSNQTGWQTIDFDNNFIYNGTDNLLITVNDKTNAYGSAATFSAISAPGRGVSTYRDGSTYSPSSVTTGTQRDVVLAIRFVADCEAPTCYAPMLSVVDYDSLSLTINWWHIGQESNFVVRYKEHSAATYTNEGTQTDTFFVFTNLQPATMYDLMVGSICGADTLWTEISARTECSTMQIPYYNDFESDEMGLMAACWTSVGNTNYGGVDYPAVTDNGYQSEKALSLIGTDVTFVVSDAVPLSGDSIAVSFWSRGYYSQCQAGVMTDPTNPSTFTTLLTTNYGGYNGAYEFYEFNTATLSADSTYYIAFRHASSYSYYRVDIDNVSIRHDDGCRRPTFVTMDSIDVTYAEVSWNDNGGNSSEYVVVYHTDASWDTITAATTNANLTGLMGAHNYELMVGAVCLGGDTLWSNPITFASGCAPAAVPYVEIFDSPDGSLPPCWIISNTSLICYDNWPLSSGDGALFARAYSAGEYAALPVLDAPFNKLQISFKGKVGNVSEGDGFMMGVYDDATNTVTWVDTITNPSQSREGYVNFTYDYTQYMGYGTRIAIGHSHNNSTGDWGFYVDSIVVVELPDCFPPQNVTAHTQYPLTADDAYFTWTPNGPAEQWQIYIDTITSTINIDSVPDSDLVIVDTNFYNPPAGMLADGAKYRFFIRSYCGWIHSDWIELQNGFFTNEVWMNNTGAFDTVVGCDFAVMDNGGPVAGYLHNSNSALVLMPSGAGFELQIQRAFFNTGDDQATFTVYDGVGTSGTQLYQRSTTNAHAQFDTLSNIATSTMGAMTITFTSGYYAGLGYELFVHCVPGASCYRPTNVATTAVSYDEASLTWEGNASTYHVYYRAEGSTAWSMATAAADNVTLTGLTATTTYEVYVVGVCSATDSSMASIPTTFTTICAPVTITASDPMVEDFEDADAPADCFTVVYGDENSAVNTMTHDATHYSGTRSFRFSSVNTTTNYNQYLITPMLNADENMVVTFYTKTNAGTAPLRIGYSTTGRDITTDFSWNPAVSVGDASWTQLTATIPATAKYVAINYAPTTSQYYLYVDSLMIGVSTDTASCFAPSITTVTSTSDAITVNFSADTIVEAAITTGSNWPSSISGTLVTTGSPYTFSGLAPSTQYTIGLRTVCDAEHSSAWSTYTISTTEAPCDVPTDLTYSDLSYTSAVITWNGGNAGQWQVRVANGDNADTIIVNVASITLDRLAAGTQYNVMVRAICSSTNVSDWSATLNILTLSCGTPTNLTASAVTQNSAVLNWNSDASEWEIEVNSIVTGVNTKPYTLTGLNAGTSYTVRVRAICTDTLVSDWSAPQYFTTESQGIDDVDGSFIRLYPNPASTTVTIDLNGIEGNAVVSIVDLNGRSCGEWKAENGQVVVDLNGYARGAYFVRVTGENTSAIRKLVVK